MHKEMIENYCHNNICLLEFVYKVFGVKVLEKVLEKV